MVSTSDNSEAIRKIMLDDYVNGRKLSDDIITESGNIFRYNYTIQMLMCVSKLGTLLAQKHIDVENWISNPKNEVKIYESELLEWS